MAFTPPNEKISETINRHLYGPEGKDKKKAVTEKKPLPPLEPLREDMTIGEIIARHLRL